jgi:hypothetical protein
MVVVVDTLGAKTLWRQATSARDILPSKEDSYILNSFVTSHAGSVLRSSNMLVRRLRLNLTADSELTMILSGCCLI